MNPLGLLMAAAGVFAVAGGIFDWEWFMNHRKARFLSRLITRTGARVFYIVLGLGIVLLGALMTFGVIQDI
jgi:Immunity protein 17